jgi:hypothetical protein
MPQHPEPGRLAKEAELMYGHSLAALVQGSNGEFRWVERLVSAGGQRYTLAIVYPPQFPYERPKAFIVEPAIPSAPHRLGDGSLCLFDNPWATDTKCTALVVRNRAVTWMLVFEAWRKTGDWKVPEHRS